MSEIDLVLVNETDNCTIYTIQFQTESNTEFERFYNKFKDDAIYNPDLQQKGLVSITEKTIIIKEESLSDQSKTSNTTEQ